MAESPDETITIFHNPACSKSREALALVAGLGAPFTVIDYLRSPPDRSTLREITRRFDCPPVEMVRTGDPVFRALGIVEESLTGPEAVVDLLVEHPELMQRPLVVRGDRAVIARPPESVTALLG